MDIEKSSNLAATSDVEHLINESFMLDNQFTDLYLYPTELKILQKHKIITIPIDPSLTFAIITGKEGPVGIELRNEKEHVELLRDFWPRAQEWEDMLLTRVTRRDFHDFFKPLKKIGRGNFATVYLADDLRKNRQVAVKAFMKEVAFKGDGKRGIEN